MALIFDDLKPGNPASDNQSSSMHAAPDSIWPTTSMRSCWDNGAGIITCEGGIPAGAFTSGARMRVEEPCGTVLIEGPAVEIVGKEVIE